MKLLYAPCTACVKSLYCDAVSELNVSDYVACLKAITCNLYNTVLSNERIFMHSCVSGYSNGSFSIEFSFFVCRTFARVRIMRSLSSLVIASSLCLMLVFWFGTFSKIC